MIDDTHAPERRSWVASANGHPEFPIQNLPLGVFAPPGGSARGGVAIGNEILDLSVGLELGLFEGVARQAAEAASGATLNALFALGRGPRAALRHRISNILDIAGAERARMEAARARLLHPAADCRLKLPAAIGDYTDFFAGIHHATNAGKLFRPDNPLLPNYKYVPIGYHGRASSIAVSGGKVRRPDGQRKPASEQSPSFGPSRNLDYELELGVWIGPGNALGSPIPIAEAADHIAGFCLLNDWSARDIQAWEYQPLGPFLGKSFHTSVSAWVVTPEALAPFRMAQASRPAGDPAPLAYLSDASDQAAGALDIDLEVFLLTEVGVEWTCAASAVGGKWPLSLLDGRPTGHPSQLRRLQFAAGRPVRDRHDLWTRRRRARQPARNLRRRPAAGRTRVGRDPPLSGEWRHRHHARSLSPRRLRRHRLRRVPRNRGRSGLTYGTGPTPFTDVRVRGARWFRLSEAPDREPGALRPE